MAGKMYVGDVGTKIILDIGVPTDGLSGATFSVLKKIGQAPATWPATPYGTTELIHTVVEGDYDVAATYKLQAKVNTGTWSGRSETIEFRIHGHFE
ncbi:MAG: hypothetical protein V3W11_09975 [bacterium]